MGGRDRWKRGEYQREAGKGQREGKEVREEARAWRKIETHTADRKKWNRGNQVRPVPEHKVPARSLSFRTLFLRYASVVVYQ